ncbi:MAG: hypothetical protein HFF31_12570 [Flavonifractor sp.]|nr:hypothetical protein [Flavonifractor sp.]
MSTEKKTDFATSAEIAVQLENEAKAESDVLTYTHTFEKPFEFRGHIVAELIFNWGALKGADHDAIEDDMLRHGYTLTVPAFTGPYLAGMAVRACANRDDNGIRIVDADFLKALPLRDYHKIYFSARRFLLRSGS